MQAFEIWLANIPICIGGAMNSGQLPVIIVAAEPDRIGDPMVTIVPCATDLCARQRKTHVQLQECGLLPNSCVCCEHIMTVDKTLLWWKLGEVTDPYERYSIRHALACHLGIPEVWEWA